MKKGVLIQFGVSILVGIANFSMGYTDVWPSYAIPIFKSDHSPLTGVFTENQESLIGSVPMLGSLLGTILSGRVADTIGRQRGEILFGCINTLACTLICIAKSFYVLLASRLLLGFGGGLNAGIFSIFAGEYSSVSIRGTVIALAAFGYSAGVLVSYVMGWLFSYQVVNYFVMTINVTFTISMCFMKETPIYLLKVGKEKEALNSLKFYRGTKITSQEIIDEFAEIKSLMETPQEMKIISGTDDGVNHDDPEKEKLRHATDEAHVDPSNRGAWEALISSKSSLRALFTISLLICLAVCMGMVTILTYAGTLFSKAVPNLSPDLCAIALAVANITGSGLPIIMSDSVGRRILMITSSVLVSCCLIILGVLIRWPLAPDWMIPVVILMYCFCYQLGSGSVPYMLNSECYVPEVKSLCIVLAMSVMFISNFMMLAAYTATVDLLGLDGTFFLYAAVAAASALVSYLIVPETSGITTEAIQEKFSRGVWQFRVLVKE